MLAYIVTMRNGRRYTVKAEELRFNCEGTLELLATPTRTEGEPFPGRQVVALFSAHEVVSVVAREHLVSEEQGEPAPHHVRKADDCIPF